MKINFTPDRPCFMTDKIRYLYINSDLMTLEVRDVEPTKADLEEVDAGFLTIVKVVDGEFMQTNIEGNFELIEKKFIND